MITPVDSLALEISFRDLVGLDAWQRLIAEAEMAEIAPGTVLMRRGEGAPALYAVEEGALEVIDARSSPETVLNVLGPGQLVGEMSFLDRAPASSEVRAQGHALCHRWQPERLVALLDADPALAVAFYRAMAAIVVVRARRVMSAAVAGGFGGGPVTRERAEGLELDRVADTLAIEISDPLAWAGTESDPSRAIELADALTATCRWFAVTTDIVRAEEVGERLRDLLGEWLSASATTAEMLARPEGYPAGPELFRHVLSGRPGGRDPGGLLLDGALLQLPTFRGWRWRDTALAEALAETLPATGARVLSVSLTGAPTSEAQVAVLRARAGHVTSVQLSPHPEVAEAPPGLTRTTVVADLPSLLRGSGPKVGGPHHAVIIDRVSDVVPDEVLRSLLAWARLQLTHDGKLMVGHSFPADDIALLDHMLRWPSIPRRTAAVVALLPSGGSHSALIPHDDEAAGLVLWSPRT